MADDTKSPIIFRKGAVPNGGSIMSQTNGERESRYFTGDERELQEIKNKVVLQKLQKSRRIRKRISQLLFAGTVLAVVAVFLIVCFAVFFRIREIEVIPGDRYSKEHILSLTGIEEGMSLFEVSNRDLEVLYGDLAYVSDARIMRKFPDTLIIELTEDEGRYVCELYGEYFVLSEEFRVLDRVFDRSALDGDGLVELVLPEINSAVVGYTLEFENDISREYVTAYVDALEASPMIRKVTSFDLRDRFELAMIAEGRYLIDFGSGDELGTKLTVVAGVLDDPYFDDEIPATIGATDPSECHVIKNHNDIISFE